MNDSGQVVGDSYTEGDAESHAFSWTQSGGMGDLGTLGGTQSAAHAVNDSGQFVGFSTTAGDAETHAFSWTQSGGMKDLGTLGGTQSVAQAVNASGQVVGFSNTTDGEVHAALWQDPVTVVWVGLKNSDDVGIRFDLQAKVYLNGSLVGSGTLNSVAGGSSGFNNAKLHTIPLTLTAPISIGENLRSRFWSATPVRAAARTPARRDSGTTASP